MYVLRDWLLEWIGVQVSTNERRSSRWIVKWASWLHLWLQAAPWESNSKRDNSRKREKSWRTALTPTNTRPESEKCAALKNGIPRETFWIRETEEKILRTHQATVTFRTRRILTTVTRRNYSTKTKNIFHVWIGLRLKLKKFPNHFLKPFLKPWVNTCFNY